MDSKARFQAIKRIKDYDYKNYSEYIVSVVEFNHKQCIERAFNIFHRHLILYFIRKGKCPKIDDYKKVIFCISKSFYRNILKESPELKDWQLRWDIKRNIEIYGGELKIKEKFIDIDESMFNYLAIEYLKTRILEKERVSDRFLIELSLFFNIKDKDKLRSMRAFALADIRNINMERYAKTYIGRGNIAKKYIEGLYKVDMIKAKILDEVAFHIGYNALGSFIILYEGADFQLPKISQVTNIKKVM